MKNETINDSAFSIFNSLPEILESILSNSSSCSSLRTIFSVNLPIARPIRSSSMAITNLELKMLKNVIDASLAIWEMLSPAMLLPTGNGFIKVALIEEIRDFKKELTLRLSQHPRYPVPYPAAADESVLKIDIDRVIIILLQHIDYLASAALLALQVAEIGIAEDIPLSAEQAIKPALDLVQ